MPDRHLKDPVLEMLLADLRRIRRGRGLFTVDRLEGSNAVIEYLGRGSIQNAFGSLLELRVRHGSDPKSDMGAYFYTAGELVGGATLDWRLNHYHEEFYVEPRTALRRSDRGARKLAHLIRESLVNERPWGILAVRQEGDYLRVAITLAVPDGSPVPQPHIYVNQERIGEITFDFEDEGTNPLLSSCTRTLPPIALERDEGVLAHVAVYWTIQVWPTWTVGAHVEEGDLQAKMEVNRAGWVAVEILGTDPPS